MPNIVIGESVGYIHEHQGYAMKEQAFPLANGLIGDYALILMLSNPKAMFFCDNTDG